MRIVLCEGDGMNLLRSKVMRDEKVPSYDVPIPRYAHSFVCDSVHKCYYMFGGNPGNIAQAKSSPNMMRLDDFWKMQVQALVSCCLTGSELVCCNS